VTAVIVGLAWAIIYYFAISQLSLWYTEFIKNMDELHWNLAIAIYNPIVWDYAIGTCIVY